MTNEILEKVAQFNKIALEEISSLQAKIVKLEKDAIAQKDYENVKLESAVEKAANALYESDFLNSKYEVRDFIKKASNDPVYLVKVLEKVCAYKDVANLGSPSSVSIKSASYDEKLGPDPIMQRCFGTQSQNFNLLDD